MCSFAYLFPRIIPALEGEAAPTNNSLNLWSVSKKAAKLES